MRAIYHDSRFIKWSFLGLWCGTLIALGTPFTYKLTSIPLGDDLCFTAFTFHRNVEVISLSLVVLFDTAVMVAISIRMMSYSLSNSWKSKLYCLIFGNEMGHTSRVFLKSSQVYYLSVVVTLLLDRLVTHHSSYSSLVTVQLCYLGMLLSPIPDIIVVMVGMFQAVFHNTMICRVFRMMKLDSGTSSDTMPTYTTPMAFDLNGLLTQDSSLTSNDTVVS